MAESDRALVQRTHRHSPELISKVTDAVTEEITTWQNRPLDPVWPVVYIDAVERHEAPCYRVETSDAVKKSSGGS
jgi:hypothetical protein